MWATAEGHAEVIQLLLQAGADANSASKAGFTPLIFAAIKGDGPAFANLLAGGAAIDHAVPGGSTALLVAVTARKTEAVSILLAHGADVKKADSAGNTPLHIAAQVGPLANVQALIAKGADLNARNNNSRNTPARPVAGRRVRVTGEQTPLMLAARANQVELMHALVAAGGDPKLRAEDGSGLLMAAAASGHVEAVQYAISFDPGLKAVTADKESVMHAAMRSSVATSTGPEICKVVQFLADRGADLDLPDANGITPLMIAREVPLNEPADLLVKLIRASGAEPRESKPGAKADDAQANVRW
jgi:ankyrin repeat protein